MGGWFAWRMQLAGNRWLPWAASCSACTRTCRVATHSLRRRRRQRSRLSARRSGAPGAAAGGCCARAPRAPGPGPASAGMRGRCWRERAAASGWRHACAHAAAAPRLAAYVRVGPPPAELLRLPTPGRTWLELCASAGAAAAARAACAAARGRGAGRGAAALDARRVVARCRVAATRIVDESGATVGRC